MKKINKGPVPPIPIEFITAHGLCSNNKELLELTETGSCFFCCSKIHVSKIKEWVDDGNTAVCFKCGIDAVLPDFTGKTFLEKMYEVWFGSTFKQ